MIISTTQNIQRVLDRYKTPIIQIEFITKFIIIYIIIFFLYTVENYKKNYSVISQLKINENDTEFNLLNKNLQFYKKGLEEANHEISKITCQHSNDKMQYKKELEEANSKIDITTCQHSNDKMQYKKELEEANHEIYRITCQHSNDKMQYKKGLEEANYEIYRITCQYSNDKMKYKKELEEAHKDINNKKNQLFLLKNKINHITDKYERNQYNFKRITLKKDASSTTILTVSKHVTKQWDNEIDINVYKNEKKWLNILKNTDIIAKPINFDDKLRIITTEYAGEQINKENIPNDWVKQRDYVIKILKKYNCRHNDIKPEEILVYNNKIKLIDFGWANELDKINPVSWPKCLGSLFKCNKDNLEFDDNYSFTKSIEYILEK